MGHLECLLQFNPQKPEEIPQFLHKLILYNYLINKYKYSHPHESKFFKQTGKGDAPHLYPSHRWCGTSGWG